MNGISSIEVGLTKLLNQIGKLRMLSHRAVMMLLLAQNDSVNRDRHLSDLDAALTNFRNFAQPLIAPKEVKGELAQATMVLSNRKVIHDSDLNALKHFIKKSIQLQAEFVTKGAVDIAVVSEFAGFVSHPLLTSVNEILQLIEVQMSSLHETAKAQAERKNAVISASVGELEKSTRLVYMISLNASIEASRLDSAGDGFKQIVREIRDLSSHMGKTATTLKEEVVALD